MATDLCSIPARMFRTGRRIALAHLRGPRRAKSGVKKRFRLTGTGKVISTQAKKRHGMIKRTNKQIRQLRGTTIMSPSDAKIVKKWMPYG